MPVMDAIARSRRPGWSRGLLASHASPGMMKGTSIDIATATPTGHTTSADANRTTANHRGTVTRERRHHISVVFAIVTARKKRGFTAQTRGKTMMNIGIITTATAAADRATTDSRTDRATAASATTTVTTASHRATDNHRATDTGTTATATEEERRSRRGRSSSRQGNSRRSSRGSRRQRRGRRSKRGHRHRMSIVFFVVAARKGNGRTAQTRARAMMIIGIINITTAAAEEEEERRSGGRQHHGIRIILVIALSGRAAIARLRAKGKIIINIRLAHGRVTDFSDSRADGWSARLAMHMLRLRRAHPGRAGRSRS